MSVLLSSRLRPLRSSSRDIQLSFLPQSLTISEVVQVIVVFIFRQLLFLVGFGNDVRRHSEDAERFVLPYLRLSMPFKLTADDLKAYAVAVGSNDVDSLLDDPAQSCLMLSAFSEPAMLLLLASGHCPIRPLGAVNVRNRFQMLWPEMCGADALFEMKTAELRGRLLTEPRKVKRGLEIDLEVEIVNLDEDVVIFRQVFTMLQFMKFKKAQSAAKDTTISDDNDTWSQATSVTFRMSSDAPLAWASICKDYNVLHISTLAAKVLGFRGRIAHGNHALSLGLASLPQLPENRRKIAAVGANAVVVEVQFRRPMVLPAELTTQVLSKNDSLHFRIMRGGRVCVTASLEA